MGSQKVIGSENKNINEIHSEVQKVIISAKGYALQGALRTPKTPKTRQPSGPPNPPKGFCKGGLDGRIPLTM